jgi:glutamate formiminotransferase
VDDMTKIIECVMNISEGKNQDVIQWIASCFNHKPHVLLMSVESDADYHRSVISVVGEADAMYEAVLQACEVAIEEIDMRVQHGVHPRIGAVDVVPFIPIQNTTIHDCMKLANKLAKALAESKNIPIFLYDEAATSQKNYHLSSIRKVEFEGLNQALENQKLILDYGPLLAHPTAGAVAIGARLPLIAYNITIASSDVSIAKKIAKHIRFSSGGFEGIKAKGVYIKTNNTTQVTINITDYTKTSIAIVFDEVKRLAQAMNTSVVGSEIIGLIPSDALAGTNPECIMLTHSLDYKLLDDYIDKYNQQERSDTHQ